MSERIREHIRSNVVGYIAIFMFAMGGTAYATHPGGENTISTIDIQDGEVRSADLAADSVTKSETAADSVGASEVVLDSLGQADIRSDGGQHQRGRP